MSNTHGKNSLSFRRVKSADSASSAPLIAKDYKFAHEAAAGETFIDIDALVTPTSISTGIINPTGSQLAAINLKNNENSIIIISSAKGTLQQGSWSVSNSGRKINLNFSTVANEIFTVQIRSTAAAVNLLDGDTFTLTGTLTAGNTDIALGQAFNLNANPNTQIGEVVLYLNGVQQFRNVDNATADPAADGNYEEVDAGNGLTNTLRLNDSLGVDVPYAVVSTGIIVDGSGNVVTQKLEALGGQLDALIPTVADLAGVPETNFQAAPNNVDLKAFADKVYTNSQNIASNDTDIADLYATKQDNFEIKFQTKILGSNQTTSGIDVADLQFNNLTPGKIYRISGHCTWQTQNTTDVQLRFMSGAGNTGTVYGWSQDGENSAIRRSTLGVNIIFTATSNTLYSHITSVSGTNFLYGDGSRERTFLTLEELPNHAQVSDWT